MQKISCFRDDSELHPILKVGAQLLAEPRPVQLIYLTALLSGGTKTQLPSTIQPAEKDKFLGPR
jgi:hypothetical protein